MSRTREVWNEVMATHSGTPLMWGPTDVDRFLGDPKRIAFFMSRYKFAAKMLKRCKSIVDVGCGSGMGTVTFLNDTEATRVVGLDFEFKVIEHALNHLMSALRRLRPDDHTKLVFKCRDVLDGPRVIGDYDGLACMDVIEHIERARAADFVATLADRLTDNGVAVIGTPNKLAAEYGSPHSQIGHINLYDPDRFRAELEQQFRHVFMFSMNDEIVHTGFDKLAHYLMAVCVK